MSEEAVPSTLTPPSTEAAPPVEPSKVEAFEKRHGKELGVSKFVKIQAAYTFIPILAAAAGAAIGYYLLAKPATKLFPKLAKGAGVAEVGTEKLGKSISAFLRGDSFHEAFKEFSTTDAQKTALAEVLDKEKGLSRKEQFKKAVEILDLKLPDVPKTFRLGSAGVVGTVGMTAGSIAVGYDKWHKEESARLAAQEINHDIANLELFKPSDPELLAENKRLSSMVAALPTIDMGTAEKQGRIEEQQSHAVVK